MPYNLSGKLATKKRAIFYQRLYRAALLLLVMFITGLTFLGVREVFQTDHKIDCIALFFTQDQRQEKKITLETCKIEYTE